MLEFLHAKSLREYNTFGFDVKAKLFVIIHTVEEFKELLKTSQWEDHKHLILGGGSNVLLTGDYDGLVVINKISGIRQIEEDNESVVVRCGAGEPWHQLVLYSLSQNWGGLENLSLIPGTVGAAPMQNIGAYGVELKDTFHSLQALNLTTGNLEVFNSEKCMFGYRESVFKQSLKNLFFIVSVDFKLSKPEYHQLNLDYGVIKNVLAEKRIEHPTIQDVSNAVVEIRQSKLPSPSDLGNSGSFFKNPVIDEMHFQKLENEFPEIPFYPLAGGKVKLAAGWLIEQAGWKGYRESGVGVHQQQALVLVNYGKGTGQGILHLAIKIQDSVKSKFGVELNPEVNLILS